MSNKERTHRYYLKKRQDPEWCKKQIKGYPIERLQKEIGKCIVLCANCYIKLHNSLLKCMDV